MQEDLLSPDDESYEDRYRDMEPLVENVWVSEGPSIYPYDPHEYDPDETVYEEAYENVGIFSTPGRTLMLITSFLLLVLVGGALAWMLEQRSSPSLTAGDGQVAAADLPTSPRVGARPPDFTLTNAYTGEQVRLSSLRGQPVWVNFWASWCPPCKAEMPEMQKRYDLYKDKGLMLLGVDLREDNATVKQFTQLAGYNWTFLIDGDGQVSGQYFVSGIPTHVFIDKSGVIRAMQVGGISGPTMDDALLKITQ